eukprot:s251_g8.t1
MPSAEADQRLSAEEVGAAGHLHRICDPWTKRARPVWLFNRASTPRSRDPVRKVKPLPSGLESRPPEASTMELRSEVGSVMAKRRDWLLSDPLGVKYPSGHDTRKRAVAAGAVYYAKPTTSCLQSLGVIGPGQAATSQEEGGSKSAKWTVIQAQIRPPENYMRAAADFAVIWVLARFLLSQWSAQLEDQLASRDPAMLLCRAPDRLCQLKKSVARLRRQLCSQQDSWQRYLPEGAKFQILRRESDERGGSSFLFEAWDPQRLRTLRAETVVIPRHLRPWERSQEDTVACECGKSPLRFTEILGMKRFTGYAFESAQLRAASPRRPHVQAGSLGGRPPTQV